MLQPGHLEYFQLSGFPSQETRPTGIRKLCDRPSREVGAPSHIELNQARGRGESLNEGRIDYAVQPCEFEHLKLGASPQKVVQSVGGKITTPTEVDLPELRRTRLGHMREIEIEKEREGRGKLNNLGGFERIEPLQVEYPREGTNGSSDAQKLRRRQRGGRTEGGEWEVRP